MDSLNLYNQENLEIYKAEDKELIDIEEVAGKLGFKEFADNIRRFRKSMREAREREKPGPTKYDIDKEERRPGIFGRVNIE